MLISTLHFSSLDISDTNCSKLIIVSLLDHTVYVRSIMVICRSDISVADHFVELH